jgi:hypothetical protein
MRQGNVPISRLRSRGRNLASAVAALGASVVMTMRIFGEPPQGRLKRMHAIEQVYEDLGAGEFDAREVISERMVLTVPMPSDSSPRRRKAQIGLN